MEHRGASNSQRTAFPSTTHATEDKAYTTHITVAPYLCGGEAAGGGLPRALQYVLRAPRIPRIPEAVQALQIM